MKVKAVLVSYLIRSHRFPWIRFRGNRFLNIRMDTTNKCNLRCSMCPMQLSDKDPERQWHDISPELFSKIAEDVFPKASSVSLSCGAEPFMNPDFPEYMRILYEYDVPIRELVTNGIMLTEEMSDRIIETPPTSLFVSIDGATPATHSRIRGGADLNAIISNLKYLSTQKAIRKLKFPKISFSVTLQRKNIAELSCIVELAKDAGADSVAFVPLVPYEGLDISSEVIEMNSEEVESEIDRASTLAKQASIILSVAQGGDVRSGAGCPYLSGWMFIDPDGKVNPCPYWNTSDPIGNFTDDDFETIWTGKRYSDLRGNTDSGTFSGTCSSCPERTESDGAEIRCQDT